GARRARVNRGRGQGYRRAMTTTSGPGTPGLLAATLPVLDLAVASVAAVQDAAARAGRTAPAPPPDPERVAAAFASDRLLRVDGEPVDGFAPLSGFFPAADGWVRTHANYPHHRARRRGRRRRRAGRPPPRGPLRSASRRRARATASGASTASRWTASRRSRGSSPPRTAGSARTPTTRTTARGCSRSSTSTPPRTRRATT